MELKNDLDYPLVSIITVTLNSEKTVRDTIESVLNQTYKNIEYIIVDGCSSDKTLEIVNEYKGSISKIISEPDSGIYDAMNKGINLASGEYIGILHSDDTYVSDAIESVVNAFLTDPSADILYGNILMYDEKYGISCKLFPEKLPMLRLKMAIHHPSSFIRKEVYCVMGGFSLRYKIAGDREFMLRAFEQGFSFLYLNKVLAHMSFGGMSDVRYVLTAFEDLSLSFKYKGNMIRSLFLFFQKVLSVKRPMRLFLEKIGLDYFVKLHKQRILKNK